jgi:hypothetical protein
MAFDLTVNGTRHTIDADPTTPLLWVIREHLGLTGTKFTCGIGPKFHPHSKMAWFWSAISWVYFRNARDLGIR